MYNYFHSTLSDLLCSESFQSTGNGIHLHTIPRVIYFPAPVITTMATPDPCSNSLQKPWCHNKDLANQVNLQ
jgi:hypothetical protein